MRQIRALAYSTNAHVYWYSGGSTHEGYGFIEPRCMYSMYQHISAVEVALQGLREGQNVEFRLRPVAMVELAEDIKALD